MPHRRPTYTFDVEGHTVVTPIEKNPDCIQYYIGYVYWIITVVIISVCVAAYIFWGVL